MKRFKSERGQSLVELGISLVILLYLLSGAVEFGILFFQFVQLRDAAQEGALYGSSSIPSVPISDTWKKIEDRARAASGSPINMADTAEVEVSIYIHDKNAPANTPGTLVWRNYTAQGSTTLACEGNGVEVTVDYDHRIFMPFMPQILRRTEIPLTATVVDTILTPVCGP